MQKFTHRIHIEISHFKKLNIYSQKLLLSIATYNVADPLLWTFVSAYLWREYQSIVIVALYNLCAFAGLSIGFYINGLLLNRYKHKDLFRFGSLLQGIIITILLFIPNTPVPVVMAFGLAFGIGSGFYWGNRIFMAIHATKNDNRIYFASLDTISGNIAKIIVPLFVGWFIIFGSSINLYSEQAAYQILAILLLVLLFITGHIMRDVSIERKPIRQVHLRNPSRLWKKFRIYTMINGMYGGIAIFVSVLMVLKFVGNEESLGTIQSVAALLSTGAIYIIARKAQVKHRLKIMALGIVMTVAACLIFGILYSPLGVILYYMLNAPAFPFRWVSEAPLSYDIIDYEEHRSDEHHYSFIFDQEFFVNLGRNTAIVGFIAVSYFSQDLALRGSLIVVSLLQLSRLFIAHSAERELNMSREHLQENLESQFEEVNELVAGDTIPA